MKKIEAVIESRLLQDATALLARHGVTLVAVSDVMRFDDQQPSRGAYRGTSYRVPFVADLKLEVLVDDVKASETLQAVRALVSRVKGATENVWMTSAGGDVESREADSPTVLRSAIG